MERPSREPHRDRNLWATQDLHQVGHLPGFRQESADAQSSEFAAAVLTTVAHDLEVRATDSELIDDLVRRVTAEIVIQENESDARSGLQDSQCFVMRSGSVTGPAAAERRLEYRTRTASSSSTTKIEGDVLALC